MRAGQDVAVLTDDDAGACAALHIIAAEPGLAAAHLLGRDGDNAGRNDRGDLLDAHAAAVRAACRRGIGAALHLLDHDLIAGQAGAAGNDRAAEAAAEAKRHRADTCQHAEQYLAGLLFLGHGGLLRCAGIAVAVIAAVVPAAAAEAAGVAVGVLLRVGVCAVAGIIGAGGVGGVHAAGAYIGVAALLRLAALGLCGLTIGCMVIETGVIIFIAHRGRLLSLCMPTVYPLIVK